MFVINIVAVSTATYFVLNYMVYSSLVFRGQHVRDLMSFGTYLNTVVQNWTVSLLGMGSTGKLGPLGYLEAALQIAGFAFGGYTAYNKIASEMFCGGCQNYLTLKWEMTAAFGGLSNAGREVYSNALQAFRNRDSSAAIAALEGNKDWSDAAERVKAKVWTCPRCNYDAYDLRMLALRGKGFQAPRPTAGKPPNGMKGRPPPAM